MLGSSLARRGFPSKASTSLRPVHRVLYTHSQSTQPSRNDAFLADTRNIGIIAHIDAGKTTTTERMLYYSGRTRTIGNVDEGSTVTDFLPAERARGITIQSAAVSFHWPPLQDELRKPLGKTCNVNLIDTPGHSDFTFEVIRSLRILDGAVCILDGVAGVEAQTEKVWYQASNHAIPRITYVNKLDRDGAAFGRSVKEIAAKLQAWPLVCQIPWFVNGKARFTGVIDVIYLEALRWPTSGDGKEIIRKPIRELECSEPELVAEAKVAREALVEALCERDELLIEEWERCDGNYLSIRPESILCSLRKCLLESPSSVTPVFAGASFRNIGIQPLTNAVVDLLPSPNETSDPQVKAGSFAGGLSQLLEEATQLQKQKPNKVKQNLVGNLEACALAFKVVYDSRKGVLVYVRVYHGELKSGSTVFNANLQISERVPRLLKMMASDSQDISSIPAGQIGVITGLKHARTGDTLISYKAMNPKSGPPSPFNELQLRPIDVPPPVFFASIEPHSLAEEKHVREALEILLREDPSLQLTIDEDSGQTHLSGMGELHLEIARDRLIKDLKANAHMGDIEISYRERVTAAASEKNSIFSKEIAGQIAKAGCTAHVNAMAEELESSVDQISQYHMLIHRDGNAIETIVLDTSLEEPSANPSLPTRTTSEEVHRALQTGALSGLGRGPTHRFRCHGVHVNVQFDLAAHFFGKDTTLGALSAAARHATIKALRTSAAESSTALMEPVMNVVVRTDELNMGDVMQDIMSARGGQILSLDDDSGEDSGGGEKSRSQQSELKPIDVRKVYAPKDPFEIASASVDGDMAAVQAASRQRSIVARIPLREMIGYLKHLRSLTSGRGTFVMSVDRFEKMNAMQVKRVMERLRGV